MRTTLMLLVGLGLLAVFIVVAYRYLGGRIAAAQTAAIFPAPWLLLTCLNLWLGVSNGDTFLSELRLFIVLFGVPSLVAALASRLLGRPASPRRVRVRQDKRRPQIVRLNDRPGER